MKPLRPFYSQHLRMRRECDASSVTDGHAEFLVQPAYKCLRISYEVCRHLNLLLAVKVQPKSNQYTRSHQETRPIKAFTRSEHANWSRSTSEFNITSAGV